MKPSGSTVALFAAVPAILIIAILFINNSSPAELDVHYIKENNPEVRVAHARQETRDDAGRNAAGGQTGSDVDLVEYFKFIPNDLSECTKLFADTPRKFPDSVQDALDKHAAAIKSKGLNILEGHSIKYIEEALLYVKLVQLPFVKTVCETGFNGGHSTTVWLSANPNTRVYSFDLGNHDYARPVAKYLNATYPGRLTVTWGNSKLTMPKFIKENPSVKCDLMIIDGGHTTDVCAADFENYKKLANPMNMILIDNYPDNRFGFIQKLGDCWEPRKKRGEIAEIMRCGYGHNQGKLGHGYSFGKLIL